MNKFKKWKVSFIFLEFYFSKFGSLETFSDSESLSRKNLAQSILAKERETELKREYEVIQIKLQYSEQALEQERAISNEAKLNVQLLTVNFI
jgi:hypothetical protein